MKIVSCKNYPECSGRTLLKADVFFGEIKCRSCGLIDTYYVVTPEGQERIKVLVDNQLIELSDNK